MFQQGLDGLCSMITLSQVEIENCSDVQLITDAKVDQILKLWLLCYRFGMRRVSVDQNLLKLQCWRFLFDCGFPLHLF